MHTIALSLSGAAVLMGFLVLARAWKKKQWLQRAEALSDQADYDLLALWEARFVLARATGQSITHVNARIDNKTHRRLRVVIRPGTYFISSGAHQNMVTTTQHRFSIEPHKDATVRVQASCINAGRPVPGETDRFQGVASVPASVMRFLETAVNEDPMVIQAGVWALTDGYSGEDVENRLSILAADGQKRQAISAFQVAIAKRILDGLGLANRL